MYMTMKARIALRCSSIVFLLLLFSPFRVTAQDVYLCVWRNPERTMTRIFPEAKDYITVNLRIDKAKAAAIEKELGFPLLPGQQERFQYFRMTGEDGKELGTVIAASQKGDFGAIEFVAGFDSAGKVKDLYIQRAREKDQRFKDRAFLDLLKGASLKDASRLSELYQGSETPGTRAVIQGLKKEMITFRQLVMDKK